jgi:mRNA-degrading endonuclease toxin of MazEF toxin-antitoxin module
MPSILIRIDESLLKALNRFAPAAKRHRAEFIRQAVKQAIRKREYEAIRQPICASPTPPAMPTIGPTPSSGRREAVRDLVGGLTETCRPPARAALSRDDAYGVLHKFVAAEITATIRHIPIEVPLGRAEGMPKPCAVNCDNLRTISKVHRVEKISRIPARRVP